MGKVSNMADERVTLSIPRDLHAKLKAILPHAPELKNLRYELSLNQFVADELWKIAEEYEKKIEESAGTVPGKAKAG